MSAGALPDARGDRLFHSATALVISNGTGAVLGIGFWAVAARLYPTRDVGWGAAEVSAMLLLASVSQLNLGIIFPRFLFAAGARAGQLVRAGYAASTAVAAVAAVIFLLVAPHGYLQQGTFPTVTFVLAVVLWVVFSIQDAALIGLRATFWVPVENTSFSIAKILLLPAFVAVVPHQGVFLAYVVPVVACIAGISAYLFGKVLPEHLQWADGRVSLPARRAVGSMLAGEYAAGLAYIALTALPTILVRAQLGLNAAAFFQTPWLAGTSVDFMLYYVATSVITEASARPGDAAATVRRAMRFAAGLLLPAAVVLLLGGHYFLELLGRQYADHGTRLLRLLAAALPLLGVNVLYLTYARLMRRVRRIVLLPAATTAVILLVSALLLRSHGIDAVGIGFLAGQGAVAAVVLPSVVRQYRRPGMAPGFARHAPLVARAEEGGTSRDDPAAVRLGVPRPRHAAPAERATPTRESDER